MHRGRDAAGNELRPLRPTDEGAIFFLPGGESSRIAQPDRWGYERERVRPSVRVTAFDSGSALLKGEFRLTFKYENDTTQVASFRNGYFEALIDTVDSFAYCIEG